VVSLILAFDCETTGLPIFKEPSDHPSQPHIVQFAALLIDPETQEEVRSVNLIVKPDGWIIPDEVAAIHGITTERALAVGTPEAEITRLYLEMAGTAVLRVAHNINFDARIMRIAMFRLGMTREEIEAIEAPPKFCTMGAASKIVQLPPTARMAAAGFTKPKPPRLAECIQHFFGEALDGAHDALVDVRACARVYFHLKGLEAVA
jgi:DNA polymerase-3 subunit epsilon